jgi:hypothetical protein
MKCKMCVASNLVLLWASKGDYGICRERAIVPSLMGRTLSPDLHAIKF